MNQFCEPELQYAVEEALIFIEKNLSNKGTIYVAFSGGKDSIVIADLMKQSGIPYKLYYAKTGIDPPELVRFIRKEYPDCQFLKPKRSFWYLLATHNPPARGCRWCCYELKKRPTLDIPLSHRVIGIRAEESARRSKYKRISHFDKYKWTLYYPILYWKEIDIWDYIEERKLPYPSLYDEGLGRLGCVICPFNIGGNNFYRKRWPRFFRLFEKKCAEWYEKRQAQGRVMFFDTPEEFTDNWYKGIVRWYKHEILPGQKTFEDYL